MTEEVLGVAETDILTGQTVREAQGVIVSGPLHGFIDVRKCPSH